MEHLESGSYATWLLGQSAVVVVLVGWIVSLHRMLRRSSEDNRILQTRNVELCASLVDLVQSNLQERAEERDGNMRTVLDAFEKALHHKVDE